MISEGFVQNGAKVYISSRDTKACEQACKEMNALGTSPLLSLPPRLSCPTPLPTSLTIPRERLCPRHPRRLLQTRRLQASRRRTQKERAKAPRPSQQLRLQLGRAVRRVSRLRMDASPDSQPNPRLHHHPSRYASPRSRRH
jgi:hypothetical protein